MKTCTKCGKEQGLEMYYPDKRCRDGKQSRCKVCLKEWQKEYRRNNPEIIKERNLSYRARHRFELSQYDKQRSLRPDRREAHKEWFRQNRDTLNMKSRSYRAKNRHVDWENGYRKRAREYGQVPVVETFTLEQLVDSYGDACVDCGDDWTDVDHVIPVRFGGIHSLSNCQPVCHPCNKARWRHYQREAYDIARKIYGQDPA